MQRTVSTDRSGAYNEGLVFVFDDVKVSFLKMIARKLGLYVTFQIFFFIVF